MLRMLTARRRPRLAASAAVELGADVGTADASFRNWRRTSMDAGLTLAVDGGSGWSSSSAAILCIVRRPPLVVILLIFSSLVSNLTHQRKTPPKVIYTHTRNRFTPDQGKHAFPACAPRVPNGSQSSDCKSMGLINACSRASKSSLDPKDAHPTHAPWRR